MTNKNVRLLNVNMINKVHTALNAEGSTVDWYKSACRRLIDPTAELTLESTQLVGIDDSHCSLVNHVVSIRRVVSVRPAMFHLD